MEVKAEHVWLALPVVVTILNEKRKLPHKAGYRIGRLYDQLKPEYDRLHAKSTELLKAHGAPVEGKPDEFQLTEKFMAEWKGVVEEQIEVTAQPLKLEHLGDSDAILPAELMALGPFLSEE